MKKLLLTITILSISMSVYAAQTNVDMTIEDKTQTTQSTTETTTLTATPVATTQVTEPVQEDTTPVDIEKKDLPFFTVTKDNQTFYYDKSGSRFSRSKVVNNNTFFYDKFGNFEGKSTNLANKTYYYGSIGTLIGICEPSGCKDAENNDLGQNPPLPIINNISIQ